jgi:hypothetical protein
MILVIFWLFRPLRSLHYEQPVTIFCAKTGIWSCFELDKLIVNLGNDSKSALLKLKIRKYFKISEKFDYDFKQRQ